MPAVRGRGRPAVAVIVIAPSMLGAAPFAAVGAASTMVAVAAAITVVTIGMGMITVIPVTVVPVPVPGVTVMREEGDGAHPGFDDLFESDIGPGGGPDGAGARCHDEGRSHERRGGEADEWMHEIRSPEWLELKRMR